MKGKTNDGEKGCKNRKPPDLELLPTDNIDRDDGHNVTWNQTSKR